MHEKNVENVENVDKTGNPGVFRPVLSTGWRENIHIERDGIGRPLMWIMWTAILREDFRRF